MIDELHLGENRIEELKFDFWVKLFLIKLYFSFDRTQNFFVPISIGTIKLTLKKNRVVR